jgi:hypothetical protein
MSFAMAFFALSALLTVTGVKITDVRRLDMRPAAVMRGAFLMQGKAVKYWENIRFVYEVESRLRELRRTVEPEPAPVKQERKRTDPAKAPNYSLDEPGSRYWASSGTKAVRHGHVLLILTGGSNGL